MNQALSQSQIAEFLGQTPFFQKLGLDGLKQLASHSQLLRYRVGQPILERERMPAFVAIIYTGQARLLGNDQRTQSLVSIHRVGPGSTLGWISLIRGIPCETAIASTESVCITIEKNDFLEYLDNDPEFKDYVRSQSEISEIFELWSQELQRRPENTATLKDLSHQVAVDSLVANLPPGRVDLSQLDPQRVWLVSSGEIEDFPIGSRLVFDGLPLIVASARGARVVGFVEPNPNRNQANAIATPVSVAAPTETPTTIPEILYAPHIPPEASPNPRATPPKYPFIRGQGLLEASLACFQMLGRHLEVPCRRDVIRKVLDNQIKTTGQISLYTAGGVVTMMGIPAQLLQVNATFINRLKAPVLVQWPIQGQKFEQTEEQPTPDPQKQRLAILYNITEKELVLAVPEEGIKKLTPEKFIEVWGPVGQVLLLQQPKPEDIKEKFSFWWFLPSLLQYRRVLIEVFVASFFVQMFGLVNPLITQLIIDKVLGQKSPDTLDVLGAAMILVALFEAILNSLRNLSFADTTNRIDLNLGSQVIDHLLRLPLNYFDNRRVGETVGRINELANIRQFLTGTALTVVLDAVFSVIYIGVMLSYSLLLTVVALGTVPIFGALIFFVSPVVQRLLLRRAERYADSQSYLVEVLSGVQTVKAQTIELKSRWSWYEKYARFMKASFKTVQIATVANAFGSFLNTLSSVALLWVGVHLVLDNQMTLGALIAFRIISGNVTGALLRFVQVWQNFQETAMSIERLRDVLDKTTEGGELNLENIPMPEIQGQVKFDSLSFTFTPGGKMQLANVNLEFPAGTFVGIVGQSGSGKSTLMKLLQRLYEPLTGRIQIDSYDISKVELYSLRRQMGMVLQDTLLFSGTVRENIALNNPDATTDQIIEAAKIAAAHDFIMDLPNGYNTLVGERGSNLSGGQRQRLAIARTVLQNPNLLMLDEATSALDYNLERQVCDNLAIAFAGRTVFFITHRLPTVKNADVIIMMEQGAVVEKGTHKELMELKGRYFCLYQQQESEI